MKLFLIASAVMACALAQQQTTPVPILKQINRHNEDGSYSYGYEAADGSYKIESKYPTGEVFGKYGYVDDSGKLREIEYGASRRGFEPAGNEINVPPPTLQQNNNAVNRPLNPNEEDDGQYREDPSIYYKDDKFNNPAPAKQYNYQPQQQQQYQPQQYQQPQQFQQQYQQPQHQQQSYQQQQSQITGFLNNYQQPKTYQPQPAYHQQSYQQQPQARYHNPAHPNFNPYAGHPASNFDVASGSYSVNYKR